MGPVAQISIMFDPKVPIDNKSALVQVMACEWTCDKPLPVPMLNYISYAVCTTGKQWV